MYRTFLLTTVGMSMFVLSLMCFAAIQPTFDFQYSKSSPTKPNAPIPPSEFANQVKNTNTQQHNQFKQQLDQKRNELSHPAIPTLSQVQSMAQTAPPATLPETPAETTNNTNVAPPKQNKQPVLPRQTEQPPVEEATQVPPAQSTTPASTPPPRPVQSQPYTGFPTQAPGAGGTEQKNNGGFNIQY